MLDVRDAQNTLENALHDAILYALGHRLTAVASAAALRAVPTQGASGHALDDDALINIVVSGAVSAAYRFNTESTAADNGTTVVKPDDVSGNGRWLRWTSDLRFVTEEGEDSVYLHEILDGPLQRVIVIDKKLEDEDVEELLGGVAPAVYIAAIDDDPEDAILNAGRIWFNDYTFEVGAIAEHLGNHRKAAQGTWGANRIDGFIRTLISGVRLYQVVDGVRAVSTGRGQNWTSKLVQRRVFRTRVYTAHVTEEYPGAPNDAGAAERVDAQSQMTDLNAQSELDLDNLVVEGFDVSLGVGLVKTISAGTAVVDGEEVSYAGELVTFTANKDTYRDLLPDGTIALVEASIGTEEPAVTATALRVGVTRTDGSGVVADRFIAATKTDYMNPFQHDLT